MQSLSLAVLSATTTLLIALNQIYHRERIKRQFVLGGFINEYERAA